MVRVGDLPLSYVLPLIVPVSAPDLLGYALLSSEIVSDFHGFGERFLERFLEPLLGHLWRVGPQFVSQFWFHGLLFTCSGRLDDKYVPGGGIYSSRPSLLLLRQGPDVGW